MAKEKELEDWTYTELVNYCTGHILQELIAGRFKSSVHTSMELAVRWRIGQDRKQAESRKKK